MHLEEPAHAVRLKGRASIALQREIFADMVHQATFEEKYVPAMEQASVARGEEVVLQALEKGATYAREDVRILAPELVLKDLTEEHGRGLFRLVDKNLVPANAEGFAIVPHPQLDRLYGFTRSASEDQVPLSRAVRAFMEGLSLLRHSLLLAVLSGVLGLLVR